VISAGPKGNQQIAITLDDGFCGDCINNYITFAQNTGMHLTFNPNGTFGGLWAPHVEVVRDMIAKKQVQIGNHTWDHANLVGLSAAAVANELNRNDEWIQSTFGITSRPWFRPPYGSYNAQVINAAASVGFTNILMWNGSFGDSGPITPQNLIGLANQYLQPGAVMLGHLNYETIFPLWPQIEAMIAQRNLNPVTLDEMFGTSRTSG
jgi:peptidoglycan/xylan/chitin deacetylase (PgdA/CDA1 family)